MISSFPVKNHRSQLWCRPCQDVCVCVDNRSWEVVKSFHNGLGAEMVLWLRYLVFNVLGLKIPILTLTTHNHKSFYLCSLLIWLIWSIISTYTQLKQAGGFGNINPSVTPPPSLVPVVTTSWRFCSDKVVRRCSKQGAEIMKTVHLYSLSLIIWWLTLNMLRSDNRELR